MQPSQGKDLKKVEKALFAELELLKKSVTQKEIKKVQLKRKKFLFFGPTIEDEYVDETAASEIQVSAPENLEKIYDNLKDRRDKLEREKETERNRMLEMDQEEKKALEKLNHLDIKELNPRLILTYNLTTKQLTIENKEFFNSFLLLK
mgnify:CR=1 FL=1